LISMLFAEMVAQVHSEHELEDEGRKEVKDTKGEQKAGLGEAGRGKEEAGTEATDREKNNPRQREEEEAMRRAEGD